MMSIEIRRAGAADAEAIAVVHSDARSTAMPWLAALHSRNATIAYFAEHVLTQQEVWVAGIRNVVVGFVALTNNHIDHLYVAPANQRQGVGDKLLTMAKELRPDGLTLWTFQRNVLARRFYEARGFVAAEFTDGAANEEREPDVLYRWFPSSP